MLTLGGSTLPLSSIASTSLESLSLALSGSLVDTSSKSSSSDKSSAEFVATN